MAQTVFASPRSPWQDRAGVQQDVILNSRVRLARNLKEYPFPGKASPEQLAAVLQGAAEGLPSLDGLGRGTYDLLQLDELEGPQWEMLVEKHLSTAAHIASPQKRGLLLRQDEAAAIMVNEEDHFRIQTMCPGFSLETVWEEASAIDDSLEGKLNFAFRDDFGYLTSSPADAGTGLMASVTLHLPALVMLKRFSRLVQGVTQLGYSVRSLYRAGTDYVGNVFQISNQIRLGVSEKSLLEQLGKIAGHIAQEERDCRCMLWEHNRNAFQDRLSRSYGILAKAWMMEEQEALVFLSDLRLASDMGVAPIRPQAFETLLVLTQPAFLQSQAGDKKLSDEEQAVLRARVIRDTMAAYTV